MAKLLYCWRCQREMPMLDEAEWAEMEPLLARFMEEVKEYRRIHNVSLSEAHVGTSALKKYIELTGFEETNINAVWHHRIALYGPPCTQCGRLLRSPRASYCAECGASPPAMDAGIVGA